MIDVYIKTRGKWERIETGPFSCITEEQLNEARRRFKEQLDASTSPFDMPRSLPQSVARMILRDIVPSMSDFDTLVLGYAVTSTNIRIQEIAQ